MLPVISTRHSSCSSRPRARVGRCLVKYRCVEYCPSSVWSFLYPSPSLYIPFAASYIKKKTLFLFFPPSSPPPKIQVNEQLSTTPSQFLYGYNPSVQNALDILSHSATETTTTTSSSQQKDEEKQSALIGIASGLLVIVVGAVVGFLVFRCGKRSNMCVRVLNEARLVN